MEINLLDWKFWLFLVIVFVVIRWIWVRKDKNKHTFIGLKPLYRDEENSVRIEEIKECINDPDEIIVITPLKRPIRKKNTVVINKVNLTDNGKSSIGEHLTCEAFKSILGTKNIVKNYRPKFLTNPKTGRALEIDCYSLEKECGVEYNGIQHYEYPNPFNTSEKEFNEQVERDLLKRELADNNGTPIFTVPCTVDAVVFNSITQKYNYVKRSREKRYELIYNYLKQKMEPFLNQEELSYDEDEANEQD